jgi:hypothetical protein
MFAAHPLPAGDNLAAAAEDRLQAADALHRAEVAQRRALQHRVDALQDLLRNAEERTDMEQARFRGLEEQHRALQDLLRNAEERTAMEQARVRALEEQQRASAAVVQPLEAAHDTIALHSRALHAAVEDQGAAEATARAAVADAATATRAAETLARAAVADAATLGVALGRAADELVGSTAIAAQQAGDHTLSCGAAARKGGRG